MTMTESDAPPAELVEMWRDNLRKSQQTLPPAPVLTSALVMNFDGAGQALTVGMGGIPEMPPGAFRIIGCHLTAGIWNLPALKIVPIATTASVDISLASQGQWVGGSRPIYGTVPPSLTAAAEADIDVSSWIVDLQPGDILAYALSTFSGAATVLTVTLTLRRVDAIGIGAPAVTDSTGAGFTNASGQTFTLRS